MKRMLLGVLLVAGLVVGQVLGDGGQAGKEEPTGLGSFKFGATWTDLRQQAIREYGLEQIKGSPDSWRQPKDKGKLFFSFRAFSLIDGVGGKDFVIDHWVVAGKEYEVQFSLDSKDRFYAYRLIEIPSVDLKDYETVVAERLRRWQGQFTEQFGKPTEERKLPEAQTLKAVHTPVTVWKLKTHTASVVIFHRGKSYNAHAVVQDDALAAEETARQIKEE